MSKIAITSKLALEPSAHLVGFDTEFWGRRIGRTNGADIDRWAAENTIGTVCLLVDADKPKEAQDAEASGFRFMDVRVELQRRTAPIAALCRPARESDLPGLVALAREAHRITRFYADPFFDDARCDDLYEAWIRNSFAGWAQTVLVAEVDGEADDQGGAAGYCTVHIDEQIGSIGLIAVRPDCRKRGIGAELVEAAIDWCHAREIPEITVVTQGRNIAAQRVFQRCGFRTSRVDLWMHKEFPPTV
jgi:dTDP-4-amino-4,6-dideoxy-D-galactose acyltransferase